ncbi:MAG: hypothetical protein ACRYG8_16685 [Janthinobacterium lividum]
MSFEIKDRPDLDALITLISLRFRVVDGPLHDKAEFWREKFVQDGDALLPLINRLRRYQRVPSAFNDIFLATLQSTLVSYSHCCAIRDEYMRYLERNIAELKEKTWWLKAEQNRLERLNGKFQ